MEQLIVSPYIVAILFFVVAFAYSSTGLGGGSSYTALLAMLEAGHRAIPPVSLTLNIAVTVMGAFNYLREGHGRLGLIGPLLATSIPMAYAGASIEVDADTFYPVLIAVLLLVAARIFIWPRIEMDVDWNRRTKIAVIVALGAAIGFVSGMVGIGGGVFLVALIVILKLGDPKEAAAAGSLYVLANSAAGLAGHLQRYVPDFGQLAPLVGAVVLGGLLGSRFGAAHWKRATVRTLMGVVVSVAAVLLTTRLL